MASQEPARPTILPHATIDSVNSCKISGRDSIEQQGTANVIGRDNLNVVGTLNQNIVLGNPNSDDPIQRLLFDCALDALVDSKERYNSEQYLPPRCAPATRSAILQIIIRWVNQGPSAPLFLWLTGSAGAGKTAICQTIAEIFQQEGTLLANFFFSRSASFSGRSNGDRLIPTLIWQVQKNLPETQSHIKQVITNDPSVFKGTLAKQLATLFCAPLNQISLRKWLRALYKAEIRLIVIDGLDECQGTTLQCDLLRAMADTITLLALPLRILISSRPEAHIHRTFRAHPMLRTAVDSRIDLDEVEDATAGVSTFVCGRFREIHRSHPLAEYLDPLWPPEESVTFIVSKSSPQYIFAATVMNYISFPDARPDLRLNAIITMIETRAEDDSDEQPLENLDTLYRFIFSGVKPKNRSSVWIILGVIHLASRRGLEVPTASPLLFEKLFGVQPGQVGIMLIPLLSIISMPKDNNKPIRSLHASLFDFLLDPQRSKNLVLDLAPAHLLVLDYYILESERLLGQLEPGFFLRALQHAKMLPAAKDLRFVIDRLVAGMFHYFRRVQMFSAKVKDVFDVLQLVFNLVERYEVNQKESGQSQLSSYGPLDSIRLPAGICNPFTSPFSKFKYSAYVSFAQAYSSLRAHECWQLLHPASPAHAGTETLMLLITAVADVSAEVCLRGQHKGLIFGFKSLVRIGELFASSRAVDFSWEEEQSTVCRKSVIHLCESVLNTSGLEDNLRAEAEGVCMVWTRLESRKTA